MSDYTHAEKFEYQTYKLLKDIGFKNVKGGPRTNINISGNQIDVMGECDNKLILIECTTQKSNLKSKIEKWKGKQADIRRGLQNHERYNDLKSNQIKFILHSYYKKIKKYKEFASKNPEISIWGPKIRNYYEELAKRVPSRARYDLLADLGFSREEEERIKMPAIKWNYNNIEMFSFFVDPSELIKVSYVARRETGKEGYYQRMVKKGRIKKIREDFLKGGGIFPTNIVLNINDNYNFKKNKQSDQSNDISIGELSIGGDYQSCWVIDGQHRLFSFDKTMTQKVPVFAFGDINEEDQMQYFVEINKNAKPVGAKLIWDLESVLNPNGERGIISRAVKRLNGSGVFKDKVYIPSENSKGNISMASICSSIERKDLAKEKLKCDLKKSWEIENPLFNSNPNKRVDNIYTFLNSYFSVFYNRLEDEEGVRKDNLETFLNSAGGISVLIYLLKIILSIDPTKGVKRKFENYCNPVVEFLLENGKTEASSCVSESGKDKVLDNLLQRMSDANIEGLQGQKIKFEDFLHIRDDLFKECRKLENKFREKLDEILKYEGKTKEEVKKMFEKKHISKKVGKNNFFNNLAFGSLRDFIWGSRLRREYFESVFIIKDKPIPNDSRYHSKKLFEEWLNQIHEARNKLAHYNSQDVYIPTQHKEDLRREIERMLNLLDKFSPGQNN